MSYNSHDENNNPLKFDRIFKKDLIILSQKTFGAKNLLQNVKNSIKSLVEVGGYFAEYQ